MKSDTVGVRLARPAVVRWAPLAFAVAFMAFLLMRAGTSPFDLLRYAWYAGVCVTLPGTLVYRALRPVPRTLVEDLAMGAAIGLVLELGGYALFSALDLRGVIWLWPLLVVAPFVAVPRLRREWRPAYEERAALGWSWTVAAVVCFFTAYLAMVFLDRNPILPTTDATLQYLDLPYQLSLAGEATHAFPPGVPQVAGEPLYYHWFAYAHMAMTSMVGFIDLPVVTMRLAIPALCALAILLTGVVGWRISNRPMVGAVAAVLFFGVGEFNFTHPVTLPFGTQVTFVIWHGMSMIYSWVLLIALILPLADVLRERRVRWRPLAVAALLLVASAGAKASSVPVVVAALLFTVAVLLLTTRRLWWGLVAALVVAGLAQLFATAVLYRFQTYGVEIGLFQGLRPYWAADSTPLVVTSVWLAFALNMLLRCAGVIPLLWQRRLRLEPAQWLLLGGLLGGVAIYLVFNQPSSGTQYFTRAGFTFGVILSAWGYVELFDRARLPREAAALLAAGGVMFAAGLSWLQISTAGPAPNTDAFATLDPLLGWALRLAIVAAAVGTTWFILGYGWPGLRGRGAVVLLTGVLLAGAPGLIMDGYKSIQSPNGGAYALISMPKSRVDAARFVRDHSDPDDIVATNAHCLAYYGDVCDPRSFWLSAYGERTVLVEGWAFAPRAANNNFMPFWDAERLRVNDEAITAPTAATIDQLKEWGVRWIVVDREVSTESIDLNRYATLVLDNGRMAVYQLT